MVQYTEEDLLSQIDKLADGDVPPGQKEFHYHPETVSSQTIANRFGSYNQGIRRAGYTPRESEYEIRQLMEGLQQIPAEEPASQFEPDGSCHNIPSEQPYRRRFGGRLVAAIRGSIDIDCSDRAKAVPLTKTELDQFVNQISQAHIHDQAIAIVSLLTGCTREEHEYVDEEGIEDTETDPVVLFPSESSRGTRSVSIGPLYNQFVRVYDSISTKKFRQLINFTKYPTGNSTALRRVSRRVDFNVDRPVVGEKRGVIGPQVLHRDLRCTHYLFERCQGASQAMLKRRLALSDNEIEHYNRYLDEDEERWTVKIEWRD